MLNVYLITKNITEINNIPLLKNKRPIKAVPYKVSSFWVLISDLLQHENCKLMSNLLLCFCFVELYVYNLKPDCNMAVNF